MFCVTSIRLFTPFELYIASSTVVIQPFSVCTTEHNSKEGPWNLRSSTFSYSELAATLKPEAAPHKNEDRSPPTAKRRTNLGAMDVIKPTTGDRVSYAKKMAEGYLRSEGLGKYTPKVDGNDKEKSASPERDDFTTAQPKTSPHHGM